IRDIGVTGVQTCALPISKNRSRSRSRGPNSQSNQSHNNTNNGSNSNDKGKRVSYANALKNKDDINSNGNNGQGSSSQNNSLNASIHAPQPNTSSNDTSSQHDINNFAKSLSNEISTLAAQLSSLKSDYNQLVTRQEAHESRISHIESFLSTNSNSSTRTSTPILVDMNVDNIPVETNKNINSATPKFVPINQNMDNATFSATAPVSTNEIKAFEGRFAFFEESLANLSSGLDKFLTMAADSS